jgi:cell division protein FtsW (lipid II flippase)
MYSVDKTKSTSLFRKFDYFLLINVLLLSGIGLTAVSSATKNQVSGDRALIVQIVCMCIGFGLSFILCKIDYRIFRVAGFYLYCV